jgi:hypothetical protein
MKPITEDQWRGLSYYFRVQLVINTLNQLIPIINKNLTLNYLSYMNIL